MNDYTFTYYGFVPSYGDFDQEWITIKATSYPKALEELKTKPLYTKYTPVLVSVNGKKVTKKQMKELEMLTKVFKTN